MLYSPFYLDYCLLYAFFITSDQLIILAWTHKFFHNHMLDYPLITIKNKLSHKCRLVWNEVSLQVTKLPCFSYSSLSIYHKHAYLNLSNLPFKLKFMQTHTDTFTQNEIMVQNFSVLLLKALKYLLKSFKCVWSNTFQNRLLWSLDTSV